MTATLSLLFRNDSGRPGAVCVYQRCPEIEAAGGQPVAWITKSVAPSTNVLLSWTTDHDFVWREALQLSPTVAIQAWQAWPADLAGNNQITVTREQRFYTFADQTKAPQPGSLVILTDANIAPDVLSIGIGTGDMVTFISAATPGLTRTFVPEATYWIAFGDFVMGQVIDPQSIASTVELPFSSVITEIVAVVEADESWRIRAF